MAVNSHFDDVAHVIQVTGAPDFPLAGIGGKARIWEEFATLLRRSRLIDCAAALYDRAPSSST
jgi:hypothetical protein